MDIDKIIAIASKQMGGDIETLIIIVIIILFILVFTMRGKIKDFFVRRTMISMIDEILEDMEDSGDI